ncbi:hypothetical protein AOG1_02970 [Geobacter sp. AOG1]|nr:hypothetical protein AOG1_02970 [Geobacter sp. AOG1]
MGKAGNSERNFFSSRIVGITGNPPVGVYIVNISIVLNKVDMLTGMCGSARIYKGREVVNLRTQHTHGQIEHDKKIYKWCLQQLLHHDRLAYSMNLLQLFQENILTRLSKSIFSAIRMSLHQQALITGRRD